MLDVRRTHPAASVLVFLRDAPWLTQGRLFGYSTAMVAASIAVIGWVLAGHGGDDPLGHPVGTDFVDLWTVSWALHHGREGAVYAPAALMALEQEVHGSTAFYAWEYPPAALLIVYPLALLPYLCSLGVWLAIGLAGYLSVLWRILPRALTLWAGLAFPAVLVTITHGQNSFLTTALFGWGLLLLRQGPVSAGILFGLLTFKPQVGVLLPVALVAGGHWRTIAAAALTGIVLAAATAVLFGGTIWTDFVASAPFTRDILESGALAYYKLQSVFAAVRLFGGPLAVAYSLQGLAAVAAAAVVVWVWRGPADPEMKSAALLAATPLATPYLLDYDLMVLAPAIALVASRNFAGRALPWERTIMAATCLAVFVSRPLGLVTHFLVAPFAVAVFLGVIVARIRAEIGGRAGRRRGVSPRPSPTPVASRSCARLWSQMQVRVVSYGARRDQEYSR
jgi:alpha-1,2-mannosyltransferase